MLASFDHMLLKPWLKSRKALSSRDVGLTRWFFVHSLANLFVCACAFNSMRAVLADPFRADHVADLGAVLVPRGERANFRARQVLE